MMRQHLQEHLVLQEALLQGFSGFIAKHAQALVALVLNPPPHQQPAAPSSPASPTQPAMPAISGSPQPHHHSPAVAAVAAAPAVSPSTPVCAAEVDRLSFLLRPQQQQPGGEGPNPRRLEGGSPMDVCGTPFTGECG